MDVIRLLKSVYSEAAPISTNWYTIFLETLKENVRIILSLIIFQHYYSIIDLILIYFVFFHFQFYETIYCTIIIIILIISFCLWRKWHIRGISIFICILLT